MIAHARTHSHAPSYFGMLLVPPRALWLPRILSPHTRRGAHVLQMEMLIKLIVFTPKRYWMSSPLNQFDILIIVASCLTAILEVTHVVSSDVAAAVSFLRYAPRTALLLASVPHLTSACTQTHTHTHTHTHTRARVRS
ncbi:hypothetical protein EON66_03040 [archaeon]|nr:MAG: hypothetical protein EON66_03040 [archaeon]